MTRLFVLKAALMGVGGAVGVVGMALERRWAVWLAVALLGGAFVVRFAERGRRDPEGGAGGG
ncbi:MAG TPA: hypothetical protein VM736_07005 [Gemmatimonadales bacterium]|nr:hypothetical protein [Gemmatimonadales bacterium]